MLATAATSLGDSQGSDLHGVDSQGLRGLDLQGFDPCSIDSQGSDLPESDSRGGWQGDVQGGCKSHCTDSQGVDLQFEAKGMDLQNVELLAPTRMDSLCRATCRAPTCSATACRAPTRSTSTRRAST